jgi:hypothetical protein
VARNRRASRHWRLVRSGKAKSDGRRQTQDVWRLVVRLTATTVGRVSTYFFHVVEQENGSWSCRRGREDFDFHAQLDDAIEHTIGIAGEHALSQVFVHHLDGRVQSIATLD